MDYKKRIIELLNNIQDEETLKLIYYFAESGISEEK